MVISVKAYRHHSFFYSHSLILFPNWLSFLLGILDDTQYPHRSDECKCFAGQISSASLCVRVQRRTSLLILSLLHTILMRQLQIGEFSILFYQTAYNLGKYDSRNFTDGNICFNETERYRSL